MKKSVSTEPTMANINRITSLLAETPDRLASLCQPLSPLQLRQPLGPGERSFTEDIVHLINTEAIGANAIYLALMQNEPFLPKVHAERDYGKLLRFDQFPFPELLAYFRLRRSVLLGVLAGLTENQWLRTVREEGKQRRESVYWRARGIALHELDHLADLEGKLEGWR